MLIAMYFFIIAEVLPRLGAYGMALLEPAMMVFITVAGIVMVMGAVGLRVSNNLGATIVGGIFRAVGYLFRMVLNGIIWIVRNTLRLVPRVFKESKRIFGDMGLNAVASNGLALLSTGLFLAIII